MKRVCFGLLVLGVGLWLASPSHAQKRGRNKEDSGKYGWLSSLSGAKEQARKTGKPLMVVIRCVP
ncbi:MAG: hypothetical protein FJ271_21305 [Planctomycetes bacterium]|nr:hypothetical protein [Planctomycetota bacterium]